MSCQHCISTSPNAQHATPQHHHAPAPPPPSTVPHPHLCLALSQVCVISEDQRSNGQETLRIDNGSQPGISMATQLFFALLNLDFKPLQSLFQLDWAWHDDGRFDVTLTPSDQTASRFAERILVRGSRNAGANPVEEITIDGAGDRSVIRLQAEPGPPAPLSAEERQLLTQ